MIKALALIGLILIIAALPAYHASSIDTFNAPDATNDQQFVALAPVDVPAGSFDIESASMQVDRDAMQVRGTVTFADNLYTNTDHAWYQLEVKLAVYDDKGQWNYTVGMIIQTANGTANTVVAAAVIFSPLGGQAAYQLNDTTVSGNTISFSFPITSTWLYSKPITGWSLYAGVYSSGGATPDTVDRYVGSDEAQASGTTAPATTTTTTTTSQPGSSQTNPPPATNPSSDTTTSTSTGSTIQITEIKNTIVKIKQTLPIALIAIILLLIIIAILLMRRR